MRAPADDLGVSFVGLLCLTLGFGCGPPYVPPCQVLRADGVLGELSSEVARGGAVLELLPEKRLRVSWWKSSPPHGGDGGATVAGSSAEVAVLAASGEVVERHSVPTMGASLVGSGRFFWTGEGIAQVRVRSQNFEEPPGTEHLRSELSLEHWSKTGRRVTALPGTECVDCGLFFVARWVNGRLVVLYSHQRATSGLLGPEAPTPSTTRYVTTSANGSVVSSGTLDWLPSFVERVQLSHHWNPRTDLLLVGTPSQSWLVDETLARRAGPFPVPFSQSTQADWNVDASKTVMAWVAAPRSDLLLQVFERSGTASFEVKRIARAQRVEAVAWGGELLGVSFADGAHLFSAATEAGKLGGDLHLWQVPDAGLPLSGFEQFGVDSPQSSVLWAHSDGFTHAALFRGGVTLSQVACLR